ncbi:MAG TPA: hypothetical protein VF235_04260 [Actinomycetota bacterium]
MSIRWARSATKHGVSRIRSRYVIEHANFRFRVPAPDELDDRLLYLGEDEGGVALEIMAVELDKGDLFVIHAMPVRRKYRARYEEARRWQE